MSVRLSVVALLLVLFVPIGGCNLFGKRVEKPVYYKFVVGKGGEALIEGAGGLRASVKGPITVESHGRELYAVRVDEQQNGDSHKPVSAKPRDSAAPCVDDLEEAED